tara:strand:- start:222 stop:737 length:516 start_codon:yes stop_codon:yes gene_type:complete
METVNHKDVCILDENNYFLRQVRIFRDPRDPENFLYPPNAHEIDPPEVHLLESGHLALWNTEDSVWVYEHPEPESNSQPPVDPMYALRVSRDYRLHKSDIHVLQCYENGEPVSEAVKKYRIELRDIPNKIADGTYSEPIVNPDPEPDARFKEPSGLIIFENWPEIPKEMLE